MQKSENLISELRIQSTNWVLKFKIGKNSPTIVESITTKERIQ